MPGSALHRFELSGKRYVIDPETCFCFECDAISWDVLDYYPHTPINRILHLLDGKHARKELEEVIGELEWLRATKSILPAPQHEELAKQYDLERGVNHFTIFLPENAVKPPIPAKRSWFGAVPSAAGRRTAGQEEGSAALEAADLFLARSGAQQDLQFELRTRRVIPDVEGIARTCTRVLKKAALAGKRLTVVWHVEEAPLSRGPEAFDGHALGLKLELRDGAEVERHVRAFADMKPARLGALLKRLPSGGAHAAGRVVLAPGHSTFAGAVEELDKAGFRAIEIDVDGAFVRHPALDPSAMMSGLREVAVYYAQRLLKQRYFRLDPIAGIFWRIYNGTPLRRSDPAGVNELAIDAEGGIYASRYLVGRSEFRAGSVVDGTLDEAALRHFEDVGVLTTPVCIRCWARHLCGGGTAAVHQALSGSFRQPHEPWCDAQRAWLASAVSAFSLLSSEGVNFTRVYGNLESSDKPSLFTMVRAAFQMNIGLRPIGEADAALLTAWENWNEAAYFLCNESGLFLATKYDREMDSLHPRGYEQEFMLVRKSGEPFGLLKIRPELLPGAALVWVYMRRSSDYASETVRKSFRFLLRELGGQQSLRRLSIPVSMKEKDLADFLAAIGFQEEGVLRDALYLHGAYHPVRRFGIALDAS